MEPQRPISVAVYNKVVGGADEADMLLSLYLTKLCSRKCYHHLAFHLFSEATVHAWLLYKIFMGNDSLVEFLIKIAISLIDGPGELYESLDYEGPPK